MTGLFPLTDAHVHLWNPERLRMPWLDQEPLLKQAYTLAIYHEQTRQFPIEALIFMECGVEPHYALLEAEWAVTCARQDPHLQGVIAAAPVEFGSRVQAYLEALKRLGPEIKGIRRNIQDEQDPRFCLQPDFLEGVQLATRYQFTFDLCIRHWQLPAITALVQSCPDTSFMLNHLGKPPARAQSLDPWRAQIRELAAQPNVYCKISGLVTEADPAHWNEAQLAPYIEHIWEAFGEERVVFASDWPVMLQASTYERWFALLQKLAATHEQSAQRKFWGENARRFYRLGVTEPPAS